MKNFHESENFNAYETSILNPSDLEAHKDEILEIYNKCFPRYNYGNDANYQVIKSYDIIAAISDQMDNKVIGFSMARLNRSHPEIAHIGITAIKTELQGQGLVGNLMARMEEELKSRGIEFMVRESRSLEGYADAVERHYKDRIVESKDLPGSDPKKYFKIKL